MKVYLSKYWNKSCIFSVFIISLAIIFTLLFCIAYPDEEMYILILCLLVYVLIYCYLLYISLKLIRYIIKENRQVTMYSFPKRKMSSLNLDAEVYYEVLPLIEGMYSVKKFIILSNFPFEPYKNRSNKRKLLGLAKVCKEIDVDGKQIIMPYKNEYVSNLLNGSTCYKIY